MRRQGERPELIRWRLCGTSKTQVLRTACLQLRFGKAEGRRRRQPAFLSADHGGDEKESAGAVQRTLFTGAVDGRVWAGNRAIPLRVKRANRVTSPLVSGLAGRTAGPTS